jgi:hypothetical protein
VIVAATGVVPALIALNALIFPEPDAGSPMDGLLLVQLYTVPLTAPEKFMAEELLPLHKV